MGISQINNKFGPGLVMAATGLGAGDLIAAAVAGSSYGYLLLWAVLLGAVLKFSLNEGIARWQLSTGHSVLNGIAHHLPIWVSWYFIAFLCLWGFIVAGALMSASGLAAHALFPQLSVGAWGAVHGIAGSAIIFLGSYLWLERLMKVSIAVMFFMVIACAFFVTEEFLPLLKGLLTPQIPSGSLPLVLAIMGGVGGSVTILCYGYWLEEKKWQGSSHLTTSRIDLALAYSLTAIFGIAVIAVAAGAQAEAMKGTKMALALADQLEKLLGPTGKWFFLCGFWAAVFSSLLGVWHGVPRLFKDSWHQLRTHNISTDAPPADASQANKSQNLFLLFLTFPPMALLLLDKPVWLVIIYALTGSLFMPFLATVLLYLNNSPHIQVEHKNNWRSNSLLATALLLFLALFALEIQKRLG